MDKTKWQEISVIFSEALAKSAAERSAYLETACDGDDELRRELESLLAASDAKDSFIDSPKAGIASGDQLPSFSPGEKIGSFEIVEMLGAGGMGEVYLARDLRLNRQVALKFLSLDDEGSNRRFLREARAAAALEHPHICTIHEIAEVGGRQFIVMQYVEGETLSNVIKKGGLRLSKALDIAIQTAEALAEAHSRGIVHRDIKPANIIITANDQVVVLDFGLAKRVTVDGAEDSSQSFLSQAGLIVGTVSYMSPEQVRGLEVDTRSDLWSLGVVLYEMASGAIPFRGENTVEKLAAILYQEPQDAIENPAELGVILNKALRKNTDERYQTAAGLIADLRHLRQEIEFAEQLGLHATADSGDKKIGEFLSELPTIGADSAAAKRSTFTWRRAILASVAAVVLLVAGWFGWRTIALSRARENIRKIEELARAERNFEAYDLALDVQTALPGDETLRRIMPTISDTLSVATEPSGARVYLRRYSAERRPNVSDRTLIGETPISKLTIARGEYILQVEKDGYAPFERTISGTIPRIGGSFIETPPLEINTKLLKDDQLPQRMVYVPEGEYALVNWSRPTDTKVQLDEFFIDKYEVTNAEYKEFITVGGYVKAEYWQTSVKKNGKLIPMSEAIADFKDKTGLPGPRTWTNQNYPDGTADHPVTDISWYEAAAYAAFRGKRLPTVFQWEKAARDGAFDPRFNAMPWGFIKQGETTDNRANFRGTATVSATANEFGMSPYGAFNMAGNVSEWNLNESPDGFVTSGGAWNDLAYSFGAYGEYPGLYTSNRIGFRCVIVPPGSTGEQGGQKLPPAETPKYEPSSDADFRTWLTHYEYDKKPLSAAVTETLESEAWIRERIVFSGDGGEPAVGYLYLPKNFARPLDVIHYVPPGDVVRGIRSLPDSIEMFAAPLVKSGRAVFGVVLRGYVERPFPPDYQPPEAASVGFRKQMINWITDLRRGVDYLETRDDLDKEQVGFLGISNGANLGLALTAIETRYKSLAFVSAGLETEFRIRIAETSPINFASQVRGQKIFVNGRYDETFPYNTDAKPLFELVRDPKKVVIYDGGHIPTAEFYVPVLNAWFDETLGAAK